MIFRGLVFSVIVLLTACVPTTPEARIEESPTKFWKLGDKDQALVRQGKIRRGMSPDAVYYAWGRPAREFAGSDEDSSSTLRWDYAGSAPVYSSTLGGYYGGGYGYGRYGYYPRYGYAYSPQVTYIPYRRATVWFRDNQVTKWERAE